jgi:hypothetical protein
MMSTIGRLALVLPGVFAACSSAEGRLFPPLEVPFTDNFEDPTLSAWAGDSSAFRSERAGMVIESAEGRAVWLRRRLPRDVAIEFDLVTPPDREAGGIEFYLHAPATNQRTGGYVFLLGGYSNHWSVLGRQSDDRAPPNSSISFPPNSSWESHPRGFRMMCGEDRYLLDENHAVLPVVDRGKTYRMRIGRSDRRLLWEIDGAPYLSMYDITPIYDHRAALFGFGGVRASYRIEHFTIRRAGAP